MVDNKTQLVNCDCHKFTKFELGDLVTKTKGSNWTGYVVGTYSTTLTPEGYAVESRTEKGSVQIYPAQALELVDPNLLARQKFPDAIIQVGTQDGAVLNLSAGKFFG